jgi:phage terminase large subunit GpA-like protein
MIIYGQRATKTGHQSLYNTTCHHCNSKNSLEMYTFSRYFHVFWIPFFPYRKEALTQCNHCKQILNKKIFRQIYYSLTMK